MTLSFSVTKHFFFGLCHNLWYYVYQEFYNSQMHKCRVTRRQMFEVFQRNGNTLK